MDECWPVALVEATGQLACEAGSVTYFLGMRWMHHGWFK
jgi:hypothetical protein